jgi:RHS repeat-associated protein
MQINAKGDYTDYGQLKTLTYPDNFAVTYNYTATFERPTINFALTHRGFTGHEHYPQFKIINMNGRLYDPVIARFFSPDKYVANSSFTQDFNRYTYARNNPLLYRDPSGEFIQILVPIIIGAVVAATTYTVQVACSPGGFQNWNWGQFAFNTMFGAVMGGFSAGIGMALTPALTAAVIGGFAGGAITGATTGAFTGTMSGLMQYGMTGDKNAIWRGALIGMGTGAVLGGISGGIQAKMHGGRFWDGATVTKGTPYAQNIPQSSSGQDQCLFDNLKAIDQSLGFNHTDAELSNCLVYSENGLPYDVDTWANYERLAGVTVENYRGNPEGAIEAFQRGARVSISYDQVDQFGNPSAHSVVLRNYQSVTVTKVNGVSVYNPNLRVMDPGGSGWWGQGKWHWSSFAGRTNNLFIIY